MPNDIIALTKPLPILSRIDVEKFEALVDKRGPDECWPWMAYRCPPYGHGRFMVSGSPLVAHRVAYLVARKADPHPLDVMHKCDNPPCCNPNHLTAGTRAENNLDCRQKKRIPTGDNHYTKTKPGISKLAGIKRARLSESEVLDILRLKNEGMNAAQISRTVTKVKYRLIAAICAGTRWAWLSK